ncbi:class I SAM-dependent RNA methyltransferase [Nocardia sp. NPDC004151]|uniref:class I SAM-dependent RNA methyltransferase n=1 Tax=Nocardia sp. NPDC004151 TaxID=3364304 RepID=UPI0036945745
MSGPDWYGEVFEVRLGPPGHGGFCVARHEGRVLFVRHGLPGELVRALVTEDRGGSFCRADAIDILDPSPDRVPATCPVSGPGGAGCCDFTFATPEAQRALKHQVVADQLRRLADWEPDFTVEPIPVPVGLPTGAVAQPDSRTGLIALPGSSGRTGGVTTSLGATLLAGSRPESQPTAGASEVPEPAVPAKSRSGPESESRAGGRPDTTAVTGVAPGRIGGVATHVASALIGSPATHDPGPGRGVRLVGPPAADAYAGGWRSRVRLVVDADGRAGVHRYRSTEVIADLRCPQPMAGAMEGIAERQWTPGADLVVAVDGDGMRHLVEVAPAGGERGGQREWRDRGGRAGGSVRGGDRRSTAARRAAAHSARTERVVDGTGRAVQYVAERRWELSATGFWQPHYGAAQCYSDVVAEWADAAPGALVWDLYCGVGVFAARLAGQVGDAGFVHGVEFARTAVTEGRAALRDMPWVDLTAERVERWIHEQSGAAPDVVVLDPPRAGAGKDVINALSEHSPRRVIHIGCDPASFARDVGLYRSAGYHPVALRVFDAFPGTHHVECIAAFER